MSGIAAAIAPLAHAQTPSFPQRPIKILVGFGAGGGTDTVARVYAQKMSELLKSPVIVENKPGASQLLAIRTMLASPADGYTLFLGVGSSLASGPGVRKDLPYDPLKDFTPVALTTRAPGVFFVSSGLPIKTMADLIAYAKANPGKLNYGSAGVGASNHLQMEYLMRATGVQMEHIPFKSDQDVTREVAAGNIQVGLTIAQFAIPLTLSGKLVALAVTGSQRLQELPNVPSLAEANVPEIKGIEDYTFYGLVGPAGMPKAVVAALNDAANKASSMPDVIQRMRDLSFQPVNMSVDAFTHFMETEVGKWREVGKTLKIETPGG